MTTEVYTQQPFKRSQYTQLLVDRLKSLSEGEFISYSDMNKLINADVQYKYRSYLASAIDILRREYDVVLACERGVGYRRLANNEISDHSTKEHQSRLKRDTQVFRGKLECVDPQKLNSQERLSHTLAATYVTLRERITDKKTDRELKGAIAKKTDGWLPDKDAFLAVFGDKG